MYRKNLWLAAGLGLAVASAMLSINTDRGPPLAKDPPASRLAEGKGFGSLPPHFEPAPRDGEFVARRAGLAMALDGEGAQVRLTRGANEASLRLVLENAAPRAARAEGPLPGVSNYFIGADPSAWRTGVPHYSRVRYEQVYPGIDLVYYGNDRTLEYDFLVEPGADPSNIRMSYRGARDVRLAPDGDLHVDLGNGTLVHRAPVSYQRAADGTREEVPSRFELRDGVVSFALGEWDRSRPLVIDPVLTFATYFGGNNDNEIIQSMHVDATGAIYIAGYTNSSDLPTSAGAFQATLAGLGDAFVAKLDSTGSTVLYATYLGGTDIDMARLLRVDGAGNVYLLGETSSTDFPVSVGAPQATFGGISDAFVAKLDPTGSTLTYSTYLGGAGGEPASSMFGGFAIDASGNAYVYGDTSSVDFPTTVGAPQTTRGNPNGAQSDQDVFLTRIDAAGTAFTFSTYHGGTGFERIGDSIDEGHMLALDSNGFAWIAGTSESADMPVTGNAFDATHNGGGDFFIARLDTGGSSLLMSTYIGGTGDDLAESFALGGDDDVFIAGQVTDGFPVTAGAADTTYNGGGSDIGIAKIGANISELAFATYLGGSSGESLHALRIHPSDSSVYVAGSTQSPLFPTTAGAADTSYNGGSNDGFIARLNPAGSAFLYVTVAGSSDSDGVFLLEVDADGSAYALLGDFVGDAFVGPGGFAHGGNSDDYFVKVHPDGSTFLDASYLGGGEDDFSQAMFVDVAGNLYLGGSTSSADFPTTAGTIQPTKPQAGVNADMFLAKFATTPPGPVAQPGTLAFTATSLSVAEDAGTAVVTVARSGGSSGAVSATCTASNGGGNPATAGTDFTAASVTLDWADGDAANKTCSVPIADDPDVEGDETFTVSLGNATGGATLGAAATVTILDDDTVPVPQPGTVSFDPAAYSASENGGSVTLTLTRTLGADGAISVSVTSGGGSASAGSDYTALTQTVSWADGDSAPKTVALGILDDMVDEPNETVTLALGNAMGGAALGTSTAAVTIVDDEQPATQSTGVRGKYGRGSFDLAVLAVLALCVFLVARGRGRHPRRPVPSRASAGEFAVIIAGVVATSPASAADAFWYVGARGGLAETTQDADELERALAARGHDVTVSLEDREATFAVLGGYRFANGLELEASLFHLGEFEVELSGETTSPAALLADAESLLGVSGRGLSATIGWTFAPGGGKFEITPRVGAYYSETRQTLAGAAGRIRDHEYGTDLTAGLRLAWRAGERWRIGLDLDGWAANGRNDLRTVALVITLAPGAD